MRDVVSVLTVGRYLPSLIKAGFSRDVTGPISKVAEKVVTDKFILNWINFLAFAISGLPAGEGGREREKGGTSTGGQGR